MSALHTPAPWIAQQNDVLRWYIWHHTEGSGVCVGFLNDFPVIDAPLGDDVVEANARLIAAAPELLRAAQRAWEHSPICLRDEVGASKDESCHCIACSLKSAIAKATGGAL